MGFGYEPTEWRLFIDSSNRSLKAMLLFNDKKIPSVLVGYSVHMTENYKNMELLPTTLQYKDLWRHSGMAPKNFNSYPDAIFK